MNILINRKADKYYTFFRMQRNELTEQIPQEFELETAAALFGYFMFFMDTWGNPEVCQTVIEKYTSDVNKASEGSEQKDRLRKILRMTSQAAREAYTMYGNGKRTPEDGMFERCAKSFADLLGDWGRRHLGELEEQIFLLYSFVRDNR